MAGNGREAARALRAERAPLTITDSRCRSWTGSSSSSRLARSDPDAAVIILTGVARRAHRGREPEVRRHDFILKPVNLDEVLLAAERALERRQLLIERREHQALLEQRVAEATRDLAAALRESCSRPTRPRSRRSAPSSTPATSAPQLHSRRVHGYSLALARSHGMPAAELRRARPRGAPARHRQDRHPRRDPPEAGPAHAGGVEDHAEHPEIGRQILEQHPVPARRDPDRATTITSAGTAPAIRSVSRAREIPLGARIFAIADAFDAMTYDRPYSQAISLEAARDRDPATRRAPTSIRTWWPRSWGCRSRSSRKRAPARPTRPARPPAGSTSRPRRPSA